MQPGYKNEETPDSEFKAGYILLDDLNYTVK